MKSVALAAALSVAVAAPATENADMSRIEGAYGVGGVPRWYFTPRRLPNGETGLQFTDVGSGEIRMLIATERDFVGGPELAVPHPATLRVRFDGEAVRICELEACISARRIPLRRERVAFESRGATLHGTIWLPAAGGCFAGVVLAQGSEDSDRHALDPMPQVLASRGYAVLAYDKRGTGESAGSWQDQGIEDLAADLRRAFETVLLSHREVARSDSGVIGFSEGPWTQVEAYRQGAPFRFMVALSGGALTKGDSLLDKERARLREQGLEGARLQSEMQEHVQLVADAADRVARADGPTGFARRLSYEPEPAWRSVGVPVLWIAGEWDVLQDQRRAAQWMRRVLSASQTDDYTIVLLPRANHALFDAPSDLPSAWQRMRGITRYSPGFWPMLMQWLADRTGQREAGGCSGERS